MVKAKLHLLDVTDFRLPDGSASVDWFRGAFSALDLNDRIELTVHDSTAGEFPPVESLDDPLTGILISGSYGVIWADKPWISGLIDFIRRVHDKGCWMLGICFGHHAIAHALGGEVVLNPRGREMGTVTINLTPEGSKEKLLAGISSGDQVNIMHLTHVSRMPRGAVRLAYNQVTPTMAFRTGNTFGYQAHPEFTPAHLSMLLDMFGNLLIRREKFLDDREHLENFRRSFRYTPRSMAVLANFVDLIIS